MTKDDPIQPEANAEDDGSRKSFWDHLQDLRTALVRSAIAMGVALLICLFSVNYITAFLEYPIRRMNLFEKDKPTVTLLWGSGKLGPFDISRQEFPALPPGPSPHVTYRVNTAKIGDQQVLTITEDKNSPVPDDIKVRLHNLSPAEGFLVAFHIALYAAIAVSAPFWIYFMGSFILPALHVKERRAVFSWLGWGVFLFFLGVSLTYFVLLPVALRASIEYSDLLGFSAYDWQADQYINFVSKFLVGMGIGFQFPLVVLFLVKLGILGYKDLAKYRRHVVVLSLILGAVLTTPEVITQVAMAVPLYLLYEICVWIAWFWERKKRREGQIIES